MFNLPKDLCLRLADMEGDASVEAGVLFLSASDLERASTAEHSIVRGIAFGRFVEMKRRDLGLTPDALAELAEIDTSEILSIEQDPKYQPEPSAIIHLARCFNLPAKGLKQLAGLVIPKSDRFIRETTKFAAQSESLAKLTDQEREILEHFATILAEEV